jgi:hypothetical protein
MSHCPTLSQSHLFTISTSSLFTGLTVYLSHLYLFRCLTSMPCELNVGQTVTLPLFQCPTVPLPNCTMSHSQNAQLPTWPMPLCHTCPYSAVASVPLLHFHARPIASLPPAQLPNCPIPLHKFLPVPSPSALRRRSLTACLAN